MKSLISITLIIIGLQVSAQSEKTISSTNVSAGMKAARKEFDYVQVTYMDVADGQQENYLALEKLFLKVHQHYVESGKIVAWGLAKAQPNELGIEFVTWLHVTSLDHLVDLYNAEEIETILGKPIPGYLWQSRKVNGREKLVLIDYARKTSLLENLNKTSFHVNFMTPVEGKHDEYIQSEHALQARHQRMAEINPRFLGWNLFQLESSWGDTPSAPIQTVDVFSPEVAISDEDRKNYRSEARQALPEGFEYDVSLRKMQRVTYDVIYKTDGTKAATAKIWDKLNGQWSAPQDNGHNRIKTISPHTSTIEIFDGNGKSIRGPMTTPMTIRMAKTPTGYVPYFIEYNEDGTIHWSAPFKLGNDIWHEFPQAFKNTGWKPDSIFTYSRATK